MLNPEYIPSIFKLNDGLSMHGVNSYGAHHHPDFRTIPFSKCTRVQRHTSNERISMRNCADCHWLLAAKEIIQQCEKMDEGRVMKKIDDFTDYYEMVPLGVAL